MYFPTKQQEVCLSPRRLIKLAILYSFFQTVNFTTLNHIDFNWLIRAINEISIDFFLMK